MTWKADSQTDTNGHAEVVIYDDTSSSSYSYYGGIVKYGMTTLEAEHLIKELRKAIDKASAHNKNKKRTGWP